MKEIIIDPEWEDRERERREYVPPERPLCGEPEQLDPFGVELLPPEVEPPFDVDRQTSEPVVIDLTDDTIPDGEPAKATNEKEPEKPEDPFVRRDETITPSKGSKLIGMLLSGSILTRAEVRRAYPYMLLIAFLMLIYISGLFRMQQLYQREIELTRRVKELRAASLELSARRMNETRRSMILEELARREIPLQESFEAPKIIEK